jgi:putative SOS response-associated peptidase YedK
MTKGVTEVARLFAVEAEVGANFAEEVYPGYPGLVVAEGKARAMNWGFPLVLTGKQGQKLKAKPVTNARDDKLTTAFWRASFEARRCLIPVSIWAEPVGEKGRMTRTWYGLPDSNPIAVAGLWTPSMPWGDSFAMVMVDGSSQMVGEHDRMPVILRQEQWKCWSEGEPHEALALCRTWEGELAVENSGELWVGTPAQPGLI